MTRRHYVLAVSFVAALVTAIWLLPFTSADTRSEKISETSKSPTAAQLPIGQVVLFSSGVGYFQREGHVDGTQRIDLSFPVNDINDLIKSMTLRDTDGGQITAVSYDSNVPIERTLQSFAIDLRNNPNFADILNQARGEKVEVVLQQTNTTQPGTLTGSIVGVEKKRVTVGKDIVDVECLNLWCADGIRSLRMAELTRIRFLNTLMESEFKKALETLAQGHDSQKKTVSIHFAGQGKRNVKVGYVIENPIWKTSYRLVLPTLNGKKVDKADKKPFMQGWAVVENTTDEDWNGVRMALVSGRPISFQMNLYDALFIKRPVVEPELFASLRPVAYSGGMLQQQAKELKAGVRKQERLMDEQEKVTQNLQKAGEPQADSNSGDSKGPGEVDLKRLMDLRQGVQSAATAERLGDYFQYTIEHAVNLPRQKSALLPIVAKDVEGERVSIYNERTHAKFPLLGLHFNNSTDMHLTQGPITVYEGSIYAGDARILDMQKGEKRLLSFAVDLGTEVHPVLHFDNGQITSLKAVKGVIQTTTKQVEKKTYTIANRNASDRTLIVEHPYRTDFTLMMQEKPWETARDVHRFKVPVAAGKTVPFTVHEERILKREIAITNLDDEGIRILLTQKATSDAVRKALEKAMELRGKMATIQRELQQIERQLNVINVDQERLRKNLREMPREAAAYMRYLKKFDDQETQIETLQKKQKDLQDEEHVRRKEFETYLANLTVE